MIRVILITSLIILSMESRASLGPLLDELLENNLGIQRAITSAKISELDRERLQAQTNYDLTFGFSRDENKSDAATNINFARGTTEAFSLGFGKDFSYGSRLALTSGFQKQETDPLILAAFGGQAIQYQFSQNLTLTQALGRNFLGRNYRDQVEESVTTEQSEKLRSEASANNTVFDFFSAYNQAALRKSLLVLQKAALDRARAREKFIRRRVRDGLSLKVDLMEASHSLLAQQEQVEQANINLETEMLALASFLNRKVDVVEIVDLVEWSLQNYNVTEQQFGPEIEAIKKRAESLKIREKIASDGLLPSVTFSASYGTNAFDTDTGTSFADGRLGGASREIILGVNVSWDIGSPEQNIDKIRSTVNLQLAKKELESVQLVESERKARTSSSIKHISKSVTFAEKRVKLAKRTLREYEKLYKLGKSNFEALIRAEESLIQAQRTYSGYKAQLNGLNATLARIEGKILSYLKEGK